MTAKTPRTIHFITVALSIAALATTTGPHLDAAENDREHVDPWVEGYYNHAKPRDLTIPREHQTQNSANSARCTRTYNNQYTRCKGDRTCEYHAYTAAIKCRNGSIK